MNDTGTDVVLGYCWPSNSTSEAGSGHDNGWLSRADKVGGWRHLIFLDHSWHG